MIARKGSNPRPVNKSVIAILALLGAIIFIAAAVLPALRGGQLIFLMKILGLVEISANVKTTDSINPSSTDDKNKMGQSAARLASRATKPQGGNAKPIQTEKPKPKPKMKRNST